LYDGVPASNQFVVNYSTGVITFNPSEAGKTVTCTYMGKGQILYPAERIYAHTDNPNVVETLQEIIDSGQAARDALDQLSAKIDEANTAIGNANTATTNANTKGTYAQTQGDYAKSSGDALVFKGDYAAGTAYVPKNMVFFNGATFMNILASTGIDPTNNTRWKRLGNMTWRGTYSTATTYMFGDTVIDSTLYVVYISVKDTNLNQPLTNTTYWAKLIDVTSVVTAMTTATTNANTATTNAQTATTNANTATANTNAAITAAQTATTNAQTATTQANTARDSANAAAASATAAATNANNFVHKGSYNATTTYAVNNVVEYNGSGYVNIVASTGIAPTNVSNWKLIASIGAQGIQGQTGATGTGFTWRAAYASGTTYLVRDIVSYNGNTYIAKSTTTGNLPTNTTFWDIFASKGNDGAGSVASLASANGDIIVGGTVTVPDLAISTTLKNLWGDKYTKTEVNNLLSTGYMPLNNQTIKTSGVNPRFELYETDSTVTGSEGIRIAADGNTYLFIQTVDSTGIYQRDLMIMNRLTASVNFYGQITSYGNILLQPVTTGASQSSRKISLIATDSTSTNFAYNIAVDPNGVLLIQNNSSVTKLQMTQAGALTTPTSTLDDGSGNSTFRTLKSTVATGTAPLIIASTTQVLNLNASLLAGQSLDSAAATPSTVVSRDSNGDIIARRLTLNLASGSAPMTVTSRITVTNLSSDLLDGQEGAWYTDPANIVWTASNRTVTDTEKATWNGMLSKSSGTMTGNLTMGSLANIIMDSQGNTASKSSNAIYFYATDASAVKTTNNYLQVIGDGNNDLYYGKAGTTYRILHTGNHNTTGDPHTQYLLKTGGSLSSSLTISGAGDLFLNSTDGTASTLYFQRAGVNVGSIYSPSAVNSPIIAYRVYANDGVTNREFTLHYYDGTTSFGGMVEFPSNLLWGNNGTAAIDLNNSDVIGANSIVFNDQTDTTGWEGLMFPKTGATVDSRTYTDYYQFHITGLGNVKVDTNYIEVNNTGGNIIVTRDSNNKISSVTDTASNGLATTTTITSRDSSGRIAVVSEVIGGTTYTYTINRDSNGKITSIDRT
jgi:hypothetical protein